ncbi:hypothetical protein [Microbacterium sp. 22296]|uniref:hypothetical protein n=1 Tax=Microbacterium sp. 22296 TaxID=3453903 RepID=UPI003F8779C5
MNSPAPKPANFDALTRTWNDPAAFARERAAYYRSLSSTEVRDITVPIHEPADA